MPGYYIVNSVNQLQPFESDVCRSLLKVFNDEHLIFIASFTVAELLEPLYDVLRQYVLMPGKVHADDIPVPV